MSKLVVLDKDNDIVAIMVTDKEGRIIGEGDIPPDCVVLFVDKDEWKVQSK